MPSVCCDEQKEKERGVTLTNPREVADGRKRAQSTADLLGGVEPDVGLLRPESCLHH